ncbi:MAG: epoxyqueuosine reductase QueH [Planctomycetota bacterium]|nr:epoxyqueuosine reductase QueH [Planctomycetota bacterium]
MHNTEKSILLHVCCAPCLATALATLEGSVHLALPPIAGVFFYNPNIHPLLEFRRRTKALRLYLEREPLSAEIDDEYGLPRYLETVNWRGGRAERCAGCYAMRLGKTAERAKALGLEGFTTTLLASREQDRDCVREVGERAAKRCGVRFFTADLRQLLPDEKRLRGIYKQQYCGCVFSEEERYRETAKHLYRPGGTRDHEE